MAELLRKYFVIPIGLSALSIVFVVLCIILYITKGNDSILRKKLRIGGLILVLQAVAVQGAWPAPSCYERVTPEFSVSNSEFGMIDLNLEDTSEIAATIKNGQRLNFSFAVVRQNSVIESGAVNPADGQMDSFDEKVTIVVDPDKVPIGTYELRIFWGTARDVTSILKASPLKMYKLVVRQEQTSE